MSDKTIHDTGIYTDLQSLTQLGYDYPQHAGAVKKEVAKQFESILMQMMLRSMRDANKAFASNDLFGSHQMEFYQDMFDKQMSLVLADNSTGLASMIENSIDRLENSVPTTSTAPPSEVQIAQLVAENAAKTHAVPAVQPAAPQEEIFASMEDFIKKLWPAAKTAASLIGGVPEVLIAQAALETNWGKNVLPYQNKLSSYNLFNIKADNSWKNKTTTVDSLEQHNGVLVKERSNFRSYDSFLESFLDYAKFLKQNGRYSEALNKAAHPEQFVRALQSGGYATDQDYANKILKIFTSHTFQNGLAKVR